MVYLTLDNQIKSIKIKDVVEMIIERSVIGCAIWPASSGDNSAVKSWRWRSWPPLIHSGLSSQVCQRSVVKKILHTFRIHVGQQIGKLAGWHILGA